MTDTNDIIAKAQEGFRSFFHEDPTYIVRCPGRVNLIGEHTDYNNGFVLPMALPFSTVIASSPAKSQVISAYSEGFGYTEFSLSDSPEKSKGWSRYLHGMGFYLESLETPVTGWNGYICSDIPGGANLSSSAALELAAGMTFSLNAGVTPELMGIAVGGRKIENELIGVRSGIMDQLVCAFAEKDSALLLDCHSLEMISIPLPEDLSIVVMDTGTRRTLSDTAYNDRRETCERVAKAVGGESLRDVSLADLVNIERDDEVGFHRARHVITESERVLKVVESLAANDLHQVGHLLNASHESLRNDYEVSGPALDRIVEIAQKEPGCFGARMTGGGFAGSAVALVEATQVQAFCEQVSSLFSLPKEQPAEAPTTLCVVVASAGASVI